MSDEICRLIDCKERKDPNNNCIPETCGVMEEKSEFYRKRSFLFYAPLYQHEQKLITKEK